MELFLPSVLVFLLAAGVVIALLPRFSPLIIVTLAIALLFVGTYHHFQIFWNEYRQSTWQDTLKTFAPTLILLAIFAYLLFVILSFFTGGSVPVPSMPTIQMPAADTATNAVTAAINRSINAVSNASTNISNIISNNSNATTNNNSNRGSNNNGGNNRGREGPTRSFLATI
jgi:hypothetical protein